MSLFLSEGTGGWERHGVYEEKVKQRLATCEEQGVYKEKVKQRLATCEEQGFEQILKEDCAWAFLLRRENVNSRSVRGKIINIQTPEHRATNKQLKEGRKNDIKIVHISTNFSLR